MSVIFYWNAIQYHGFDAAAEPTITGQIATMSGGEASDDPAPLYDLLDNRRTNTLSLDTSGETTAAIIQTDLTASATCNFAIIDNHNLNTAEAEVDLAQGGIAITLTNSYSGTLGSETSVDSIIGGLSARPGADGVSLILFENIGDTRWDVVINDIDTFDADVTLGEIFIGGWEAPANNPELQPVFDFDMPGSSYRESEGGQRYGFSTHTSKRRAWKLTWKYMSDANKTSLENVFKYTRGTKYPFYIDLGDVLGATNPQLFYVRFMRPLSFKGLTKDAWAVTVDIEEEL